MHLVTKNLALVALIAVKSLAATVASHPAKAAQWMVIPKTLQDTRRNDRDIECPPPSKDLFTRQMGCGPTDVACEGNQCCPFGFTCIDTGGTFGCCAVGETCSGPPVGCADPNSFECPGSIGGCCPNGLECYLDSQASGCRDPIPSPSATPIYSVLSTAVPMYETSRTSEIAPTAIPIDNTSRSPGGNPTIVNLGTSTARPTGSGSDTGTTGNGVEKRMRMEPCWLLMVATVFSVLA